MKQIVCALLHPFFFWSSGNRPGTVLGVGDKEGSKVMFASKEVTVQ